MPSSRFVTAPFFAAFRQGASSQWLHITGMKCASTMGRLPRSWRLMSSHLWPWAGWGAA